MEFLRSERRLNYTILSTLTSLVIFSKSIIDIETMKSIWGQVLANEVRKFEDEVVYSVHIVASECDYLVIPKVGV